MNTLKQTLIRQLFIPSFWSIPINPFFIARRGLFLNIKSLSHHIQGKTLDVGCGIKPYEHLFKSTEYIGMDIEQSGHDHSNSKIDVFYDGKVFPFNEKEFDSIVCFQVFEHVFNPDLFLSEIYRVLKPGGKLLLAVPFVWDEHEQPYDYARYSSFGLKHVLEQKGLHMVEHIKSNNNISVLFQLTNAYIYKVLSGNKFTKLLALGFALPFTIAGLFFGWLLPNNNDLYLDNIVLVQKSKG